MKIPNEVYAEVFRQRMEALGMRLIDLSKGEDALEQSLVSRLIHGGRNRRSFNRRHIAILRSALQLEDDEEFDRLIDAACIKHFRNECLAAGKDTSAFQNLRGLDEYARIRLTAEQHIRRDRKGTKDVDLDLDDLVATTWPHATENEVGAAHAMLGEIFEELGDGATARACFERSRNLQVSQLFRSQLRLAQAYVRSAADEPGDLRFSLFTQSEREVEMCSRLAGLFEADPHMLIEHYVELAQLYKDSGQTQKHNYVMFLAKAHVNEQMGNLLLDTGNMLVLLGNDKDASRQELYTCFETQVRLALMSDPIHLHEAGKSLWLLASIQSRTSNVQAAETLLRLSGIYRENRLPLSSYFATLMAIYVTKSRESEKLQSINDLAIELLTGTDHQYEGSHVQRFDNATLFL